MSESSWRDALPTTWLPWLLRTEVELRKSEVELRRSLHQIEQFQEELFPFAKGPSQEYLLNYVLVLTAAAVLVTCMYKLERSPRVLLRACGVSLKKVARAVREIERKSFHLAGLLVPLIYLLLMKHRGWTRADVVALCTTITVCGIGSDMARLNIPFIARHWPGKSILRDHELSQLTGGCWFSLGCTLCIAVSPPSIAMASILFLVLGDMSTAIIGVSFGGESVSKLKLGRDGKKSIEGSLAMFLVCFCVGSTMFGTVRLREYPVFFGAMAATVTELYEPLGLNDNLMIPLISSLAMQLGFLRIQAC